MTSTPQLSAALERDLAAAIEGEVHCDPGHRALYSTDSSNYRHVPLGVVYPRTAADVIGAIEVCRRHRVPITSRGGGTGLAGQTCNDGIIIDHSRYYNRILAIDPDRRIARIEPGCVLDRLRDAAKPHGLTFGPDPATHAYNTLGGMIGNNSCGVHSVLAQFYGPGPLTRHNVVDLDVVTYHGERFTVGATSDDDLAAIVTAGGTRGAIYRQLAELRDRHADEIRRRFPVLPRRVSGFNLDALLPEAGFNVAQALVGTEGTCVTVLSATVTLIEARAERVLVMLGYPSAYEAADHVPFIMEHRPVGLEGIDDCLVEYMGRKHMHQDDVKLLPDGKGFLFVEFGASARQVAMDQAQRFVADLKSQPKPPAVKLVTDAGEMARLWKVREAGLGATALVPGLRETHEGWEDSAVPPERLGEYLRAFRKLLDEFGYHTALYGHFGQGCVHCRIDFDLRTADGVRTWMYFLDKASDLVTSMGGSLSGEHGDGQSKAIFLRKMYGDDLVRAFGEFKHILDPDNGMNPGKVVDPRRPDQDLRMGPTYAPKIVETSFSFGGDEHGFAEAAARCVGVGRCRRTDSGTMCPSYMATGDERHSTRGRARLLFEMLQGDVVRDGWRDRHVHEALDLCLACKGCKGDCPVQVDMATYKAEFLSHYYRGRVRPRAAYAMGLIHWWSRAALPVAPIANALTSVPPLAALLKAAGGIAQRRSIPKLASPSFRRWFARRPPPQGSSGTVLFWPDTFSNALLPGPARAAVDVLTAHGYRVEIPPRPLCCGRPLYDWGMLGLAKRLWRRTLTTLKPWIEAGIPLVGVEPSCVAAFRDELPALFPDDQDAARLSRQAWMFGEFIARNNLEPGHLARRAIMHGHCHQRAVLDMSANEIVLRRLGVDYRLLDSGCCGMAGSFGFEAHKYDVSVRVGERVLLPAVRAADPDTLIIADGFSCREQVQQLTGRQALNLAEVVALAAH
ncbi:MAG: FAD-binding and (Fe-S)-binding domain-containing protein [Gemmatimonadales bacterium]